MHSRPAYRCRNRLPQQPDGTDHVLVAAAPVRVTAMAVVGQPVAVDGDADFDTVFCEQLAELLVQPDTVRVDPQVEMAYAAERGVQRGNNSAHPAGPHQQRLAPVQDDLNGVESMRLACSAMRCAVREITSSEMAMGWPRQLWSAASYT